MSREPCTNSKRAVDQTYDLCRFRSLNTSWSFLRSMELCTDVHRDSVRCEVVGRRGAILREREDLESPLVCWLHRGLILNVKRMLSQCEARDLKMAQHAFVRPLNTLNHLRLLLWGKAVMTCPQHLRKVIFLEWAQRSQRESPADISMPRSELFRQGGWVEPSCMPNQEQPSTVPFAGHGLPIQCSLRQRPQ